MGADDRLTELEIALTYQQALLEELNAVVRDQADQIDLIRAQVLRLANRLAAAEAELPRDAAASERPPHW